LLISARVSVRHEMRVARTAVSNSSLRCADRRSRPLRIQPIARRDGTHVTRSRNGTGQRVPRDRNTGGSRSSLVFCAHVRKCRDLSSRSGADPARDRVGGEPAEPAPSAGRAFRPLGAARPSSGVSSTAKAPRRSMAPRRSSLGQARRRDLDRLGVLCASMPIYLGAAGLGRLGC
jgi:hypothetical protein